MRIVFAGTPEFALRSLEALLAAGHEVALVLSQPDRPAGRGLQARASAVAAAARERGLKLLQPCTLRDERVQASLAAAAPEAIVVAAYGLILPASVLTLPPRGCLNVHASLLPRWRGAAPIQRALLAGDRVTGVTIMQMDEGLDTGPILLQREVAIAPDETAGSLHEKLARLGAELIVQALDMAPRPRPQDEAQACYAPRIAKHELEIDWRAPAEQIERQVRAFEPFPGAHARCGGSLVKIWRARVEPARRGEPGTVLAVGEEGIVIACGTGALRVLELQRAGGRRLAAGDFARGMRLLAGARFETPGG